MRVCVKLITIMGLVNFATPENLPRVLYSHIHKFTWTSPGGKTHNQIVHVLIDKRWHSNIADV
jgi:hypothetical protein